MPRTGKPLYLVFGTGSPKGLEAMKDAMWSVDDRDGESFHDPRTRGAEPEGQLDIVQAVGLADPELLELVAQRLAAGTATVVEIGEWLLRETSRWMPKHALKAVREMRQAGAVSLQSPGKLTSKSHVRLTA
ncbi:hypothetical protein AB0G85_36980 [Streptomyces sioyaensis]|uniref:hypothetical protein n=1 Tax=Streptomyces sioyaensis TaxID=67364 RepID=UPI00340494CF